MNISSEKTVNDQRNPNMAAENPTIPADENRRKPSRKWIFTLNNYNEADCACLQNLEVQRIVVGKEVGENGTPHLQGFIVFKSNYRLSSLKKLLPRAHWTIPVGTPDACWNYCVKEDAWLMKDNRVGQGARTDWALARQQAEAGDWGAIDPSVLIRFPNGLLRVRELCLRAAQPNWREVRVYLYWGDTGTGKTRRAVEDGAFIVNHGSTGWTFNGYDGEAAICLDEFYGDMPLRQLLRMCDGYRYNGQLRGGGVVPALWTRVYITSNANPREWYPHVKHNWWAPFERRVTREERLTWVDGEDGGRVVSVDVYKSGPGPAEAAAPGVGAAGGVGGGEHLEAGESNAGAPASTDIRAGGDLPGVGERSGGGAGAGGVDEGARAAHAGGGSGSGGDAAIAATPATPAGYD